MGAGNVEKVNKVVMKTLRDSVLISMVISLIMFIFSDFLFGIFSTIVGIISMWTVAVGLGYLLGIKGNLGLVGLWIGMALDEIIRAIIFFFRWKKGVWKEIRLVEKKELVV